MAASSAQSVGRPERDAGFTLLETLVSLGLISTMLAALAPFLVNRTVATDAQREESGLGPLNDEDVRACGTA